MVESSCVPHPENPKNVEWFRGATSGPSIHGGVNVHSLGGESNLLFPELEKARKHVFLIEGSTLVRFAGNEPGISLQTPMEKFDDVDTIVVPELP